MLFISCGSLNKSTRRSAHWPGRSSCASARPVIATTHHGVTRPQAMRRAILECGQGPHAEPSEVCCAVYNPSGTSVPLHHPPAGCDQTVVRRYARPGRVPIQATVPGWFHACRIRAFGFHRPAGGTGSQTSPECDLILGAEMLRARNQCPMCWTGRVRAGIQLFPNQIKPPESFTDTRSNLATRALFYLSAPPEHV